MALARTALFSQRPAPEGDVEREVHAGQLPVPPQVAECVVGDAALHQGGVVVRHDNGLEATALLDLVALDEEEQDVLATLADGRVLRAEESNGKYSGHVRHLHLPVALRAMAMRAVVTCQSKKAGVLPDIMNMLGGLTSPWLKVCGLEESSSWIHAKSSTMALPMAKACRGGSGLGVG